MLRLLVSVAILLGLVFTGPLPSIVAQESMATPLATAVTAGDVPMYRGDAARTGVMPGPGPAGQPVELWRFQVQGEIHSAPAVLGGVLYIGG